MTFKEFNPFTDERKKWIFLWILLFVFVSLPISHWMRTTFKIHASCFLSSKDQVTYQEIGILYLKQMNMLSGEETETTFYVKLAQGERRGMFLYAEPPFTHGFLANENDEVEDVDFLELRACDQSCPGGILTADNRFLICERIFARAYSDRKSVV